MAQDWHTVDPLFGVYKPTAQGKHTTEEGWLVYVPCTNGNTDVDTDTAQQPKVNPTKESDQIRSNQNRQRTNEQTNAQTYRLLKKKKESIRDTTTATQRQKHRSGQQQRATGYRVKGTSCRLQATGSYVPHSYHRWYGRAEW